MGCFFESVIFFFFFFKFFFKVLIIFISPAATNNRQEPINWSEYYILNIYNFFSPFYLMRLLNRKTTNKIGRGTKSDRKRKKKGEKVRILLFSSTKNKRNLKGSTLPICSEVFFFFFLFQKNKKTLKKARLPGST